MAKKELDLLVTLQDLDMMLTEQDDVEKLGFETTGRKDIEKARDELVAKMSRPLLYTYEKLRKLLSFR